MNWILIAILSYFLTALAVILDKFMLSGKKVSHPAVYAFYSGVLSFFTLLIFAPFGFHQISFSSALANFLGGALFLFGILFIFYAIEKSEASRAMPVIGAAIPIISFFIGLAFLGEKLQLLNIFGLVLLIGGGFFMSFNFSKKSGAKFFSEFGHSILAGIFLALSYVIFKKLYTTDNFINVFIWTRMGVFLGALLLLLFSSFRNRIWESFKNFKKKEKENSETGLLFIFNKLLGGAGSFLFNYAISLGSVTIVNALVATEYVFIFIIGIILSFWFASIFQEEKNWRTILQKIIAIVVIGVGMGMVVK
jgi:drug/metabolite transporter (DMT)-like permease